nr:MULTISPECIES: ROK family transcriptional regulator [unclassified Sphingomonas]
MTAQRDRGHSHRDRVVHSANARSARLSASMSGTNLVRAGDYNQRTVLQAIRLVGETSRVELATLTGLTAPTIANITKRLTELGLIKLVGRRQGARGQPALRLSIDPDGAFAIGLNIDRDHISLALVDLAGRVRRLVGQEIAFALPEDVVAFARKRITKLLTVEGVSRDKVLGVGVAMPDDLGRIPIPHRPAAYDAWNNIDVAAAVHEALPWPIHVDNDAAAAALGEAQQRPGQDAQNFFYLLISAGLGGGPVIEGNYARGAALRSGEIGLMPDPSSARPNAVVQDTVSLSALRARFEAAGKADDLANLVSDDPSCRAIVDAWVHDAAQSLASPLVAVNCLINPAAILIGGRLPLPLIARLAAALETALDAFALPSRAPILAALAAQDGAVIGAAMLPFLDHVLPSDAILIQAGRRD